MKTIRYDPFSHVKPDAYGYTDVVLMGFAFSPFDPNTAYLVNVTLNGQVIVFGKFNMGIQEKSFSNNMRGNVLFKTEPRTSSLSPTQPFLVDSVITPSYMSNLFALYHTGDMDQPATNLVLFDTNNGSVVFETWVGEFDGHPFSGIIYCESDGNYYTFSLQINGGKGTRLQK